MNDADYSFVNRLNFFGLLVITLVSKEFRKDRSLHRYHILEILTNPASVTEKFTANFASHLLLLPEKISPFPGKLTSLSWMKKKDNKVTRKEKQKGKPRKKDWSIKEVHILAYAHVPKTKMKLNFILLHNVAGNSARVLKNYFYAFSRLIGRKLVQKSELSKKNVFLLLLII